MNEQMKAKVTVAKRRELLASEASRVKLLLPDSLQRAMDLAAEKGSSSWLTSLPIEEYRFSLHQGAFHDALALRYGWLPSRS